MQRNALKTTSITLRMPRTLADDLKRAATKESNSVVAVARRLITIGLSRERRQPADDPDQNR
jgi:hypothetical protein